MGMATISFGKLGGILSKSSTGVIYGEIAHICISKKIYFPVQFSCDTFYLFQKYKAYMLYENLL